MTKLSQSSASILEVIRILGGEARTLEIAATLTAPLSIDTIIARLEILERNGLVTSSRTLDGLERIWTREPRGSR